MSQPYLNPKAIRQFIETALKEDHGDGDHSSLGSIPADKVKKAQLLIKDDGVLAGVKMARMIFQQVSPEIEMHVRLEDGTHVVKGDIGFYVLGNARQILGAERLVLNCMQRMSGVATYTRELSQMIKGTKAKLLDTRKTTPNFRLAEKWAVSIGGGVNHRFGLYDMVMLKDNHVDFAGGIGPAVENMVKYLESAEKSLEIEIEVRNLRELEEVLEVGHVSRILLDNMLPSDLKKAVEMIRGQYITEASGGITERTIREIAETGVDYISVGALTHSYKSLDMSLKAVE